MTFETWLAFAIASLIAVKIPGPVVVFNFGRSLGGGWRAAMPIVTGVALGTIVALTASLAGLGALLAASAAAFTVAKWLGAAYLVWLGVKLWRAEVGNAVGLGALSAVTYALLAGRVSEAVSRPSIRQGLNRVGGAMLMGAGIATATMRRE